jgi:hypothetical protein
MPGMVAAMRGVDPTLVGGPRLARTVLTQDAFNSLYMVSATSIASPHHFPTVINVFPGKRLLERR